eukprot:IDg18950t1
MRWFKLLQLSDEDKTANTNNKSCRTIPNDVCYPYYSTNAARSSACFRSSAAEIKGCIPVIVQVKPAVRLHFQAQQAQDTAIPGLLVLLIA